MGNEIKYSYCYDEQKNIVHIRTVTPQNKHEHKYKCIVCGEEMIANTGEVKRYYFSHAKKSSCSKESYLHKLGKTLIKQKFDEENEFPIEFNRKISCCEHNNCINLNKNYCRVNVSKKLDLKKIKNTVLYDTCEEEISVENFRADLLLSLSTNLNQPKILIEIYKTHKSTHKKIRSNYRLIETKQIDSEDDINDIIQNGFIEGVNCTLYNFNPQFDSVKKDDIPITRFVYYKTGKAFVYRALDYIIYCDKIHEKVKSSSLYELNLRSGFCDDGLAIEDYNLGLLYLLRKGVEIKNCSLCRFYKYNEFKNSMICVLYKQLQLEHFKPKLEYASQGNRFTIKSEYDQYTIEVLKKYVSEV